MNDLEHSLQKSAKDFLKGESPVPSLVQVQGTIHQFLQRNLLDSSGILIQVLEQQLKSDAPLLDQHRNAPLKALASHVQAILAGESSLRELVRQCDMQWGEQMGEKPHFDKPGIAAHPDDEYTIVSVKKQLEELLNKI